MLIRESPEIKYAKVVESKQKINSPEKHIVSNTKVMKALLHLYINLKHQVQRPKTK